MNRGLGCPVESCMKIPTLAVSLLGCLAGTGCIITPGFADDVGGTEGDESGDADGTGGADGADDGSDAGRDDGDGADDDDDDDGGADETGGVVNTCDDVEVAGNVYQHSGTVGADTWGLGTHVISGSVALNGHVEVAPCARIEMADGARLRVRDGGSLAMLGEPGSPITVTSAKSSPARGDWDRIQIEASAVGPQNVFDNVVIEYGGGGSYGMVHVEDGASLAMTASVVRESEGLGMLVSGDGALRDFFDNALVDNAAGALSIAPDHAGDLGVGTYAPNDSEGIVLSGPGVAHDQTWLAHDAAYVALAGFAVYTPAGSAHLTVEAGASLLIGDGADIRVRTNGGLTLAGTEAAPITIRSAKSTGAPGDWDEIRIEAESVDALNDFDHVLIEHGGGSSYGAVWVQGGASLAMTETTVRASNNLGVLADGGAELRDFVDNTLTENALGPIEVGPAGVDALGAGVYGPNPVEGVRVSSGWADHDATWLDLGVPYVVPSGFHIGTEAGSANVVIEAGSSVLLGDAGDIRVRTNGSLTLDGTADSPVVIDSSKSTPAPGDWDEIRVEDDSVGPNNVFRYAEFRNGGGSAYGMLWVQSDAELTLENVSFVGAGAGCDIERDGFIAASGSSYVECP